MYNNGHTTKRLHQFGHSETLFEAMANNLEIGLANKGKGLKSSFIILKTVFETAFPATTKGDFPVNSSNTIIIATVCLTAVLCTIQLVSGSIQFYFFSN